MNLTEDSLINGLIPDSTTKKKPIIGNVFTAFSEPKILTNTSIPFLFLSKQITLFPILYYEYTIIFKYNIFQLQFAITSNRFYRGYKSNLAG